MYRPRLPSDIVIHESRNQPTRGAKTQIVVLPTRLEKGSPPKRKKVIRGELHCSHHPSMKKEKLKMELRCKHCGKRGDIAEQDAFALIEQYRHGGAFPFCCGSIMLFHRYRPSRFQYCNDMTCQYAGGANCGCTCEGTFHGVQRGATERGRYYMAPIAAPQQT